MELKPNIPLDTQAIARLIDDPNDMSLVWPKARWPFDHGQWRRSLDPASGHHPFLIYDQDQPIGHAALKATQQKYIYTVNFLYLVPQSRGQGRGQDVLAMLERYAAQRLAAHQLRLVVRAYNLRAMACYKKCGFTALRQEGNLVRMIKPLSSCL